MEAWSPVTEAKWEARGIGWLGVGCTTPQRGRLGAKAEQASLLHVLSHSSLSLPTPRGLAQMQGPSGDLPAIAFSPLSGCSLGLLAWVFLILRLKQEDSGPQVDGVASGWRRQAKTRPQGWLAR